MQIFLFKVSLSWKNLFHNRQRFVAAIIAVAFAVLLIFTQLGFRNGIIDSNVAFLQRLNADLILVNSRRKITTLERTFKKARLYQARQLPEVIEAYSLYLTLATWKNQQTNQEKVIRVFAFNPAHPVFLIPGIQETASDLQHPHTLLADIKSQKGYGRMQKGDSGELSSSRVKVVGTFALGTDFVADGNLILSDQNFLRIFSEHPSGFSGQLRSSLEDVDIGLLKLTQGTNLKELVRQLNQFLPSDVKVFSKQDYVAREAAFYSQVSLGFIYTLGAIIGFVIGTVLVYNIISKDIKQNMAQYGTLRAIGYSSTYLLIIILLESLIIAILGFFPGLCLSLFVYELISKITRLLILMRLDIMFQVFILTISMCILASFIAAKKLKRIDPADIYSQSK
ncbi:glycolipid ABC exporter inner membrane subunit [Calothrix sp. NIES-4101]|nr:glycolipid ABC exporter inner membrane subunit [Calothrix sp. NIES-4101]